MDLERFQSLLLGSLARLLALVLVALVMLRFLHVSALTGFVVLIAVYVGLTMLQLGLRRKQSRRQ